MTGWSAETLGETVLAHAARNRPSVLGGGMADAGVCSLAAEKSGRLSPGLGSWLLG